MTTALVVLASWMGGFYVLLTAIQISRCEWGWVAFDTAYVVWCIAMCVWGLQA